MQSLRNASNPITRVVHSGVPRSVIRLVAGLTLAASLSGAALANAGTAAADPLQSCPPSGSAAATGSPSSAAGLPVCVSQQGTAVIIVIGPIAGASNPAGATSATSQLAGVAAGVPPAGALQGSPMPTSLGSSTYAQRQAIRDQYRGQIDELTFNDELGDGVSLFQALADAMAAHAAAHSAKTP